MSDFILGWEEWAALPELGLPAVRAKTDTGAKTSALHAYGIEPFGPIGRPRVRFVAQPWPERPDVEIVCAAPLVDRREVVSSNGEAELRYIIRTGLKIGAREWAADISLADRQRMRYRMLLGRKALGEDVVIDPHRSFVQGDLSYDLYGAAARAPVRRPLRIALLTQDPGNYSCRRIIEAAERRDHVIEAIETRRCAMNINADRPEVHVGGKPLPKFDAVIPRIGSGITQFGCSVVRQFAMTGAYCLNGADAILASRDKLSAHQLLARSGLPMPVTAFATSATDPDEVLSIVGGAPVVVKLLQASQGRGVVLAETEQAARSVIHAFQDLDANFLVQEFVAEAKGADVRLFVVGGKVAAAMRRQAKVGDFRSNLHRGGSAMAVKPSREEREAAVRATRIMGLEVAGVDVLRSDDGPKILEINSSPGLQGIEKATGEDLADQIIAHLEKRVLPAGKRRK
jgi:ribosomal protein S6--L-glutamate ligase